LSKISTLLLQNKAAYSLVCLSVCFTLMTVASSLHISIIFDGFRVAVVRPLTFVHTICLVTPTVFTRLLTCSASHCIGRFRVTRPFPSANRVIHKHRIFCAVVYFSVKSCIIQTVEVRILTFSIPCWLFSITRDDDELLIETCRTSQMKL
jgi:hypothetical protein